MQLPVTSPKELAIIEAIERRTLETQKQFNIPVEHHFWAGCYSRTILLKAEKYLTGAKMKVPTQVIVSGDCWMNLAGEYVRLTGYAVFDGQIGRKQLFVAIKDTNITMFFASNAKTPAEAEREFTDQHEELNSRMPGAINEVV